MKRIFILAVVLTSILAFAATGCNNTSTTQTSSTSTRTSSQFLARVLSGEELLCDVFDRALAVSRFLLESAERWLG